MPQLVSDIENVMSNDCETNISHFATSCSNLAQSNFDNGRSIPESPLLALLNHCHIENIHDYFPTYPLPPSDPSDSGYGDFDDNEYISMSQSPNEDSPNCSSVFEPVREEDLSDSEESDVDMETDEAAVLSPRIPRKKKRTLSETVRDPGYKTLEPVVRVIEDVQPVLVEDREDVINPKEGTLLNPIELDEMVTENEGSEEEEGEIESPGCRAQNVGFETFLKHLSVG
ncbi:hypothetical protein BKA61DRAFT_728499 [Leptodontidium sp. MPI-SDFR-AT-0119]|nr:hypothetical protein BKA61DRAFT_728499 [Leptodontidium sp. MPI-SDFR-AT-0119]